jgi:NifU-like protein involved in Fe-S cluster formation
MAQGKSVSELQRLKATDVVKGIGGLPAASGHASHLAIDALRALIGKFEH